MGKIEKTFYWILLVIAIYTVVGFKILPNILKEQIIKNMDNNLTQKTNIEKIEFNPFTFKAKIKNMQIAKDNEPTVKFGDLLVDVDIFRSIKELHLNISNFKLEKLSLNVIENSDGSLNLAHLLKENKKKEESKNKEESKSNFKFLVSKLFLQNANINYTKTIKDKKYKLDIKDINLKISDLGNQKNSLSAQNLNLKINDNTEISFEGAMRIEPFKTYGKGTIKHLKINNFTHLASDIINFDVNNVANLNLDFDYNIDFDKKEEVYIKSTKFDINNLHLIQDTKHLAGVKKLTIEEFVFDLAKQFISINGVKTDGLKANTILDKNGMNMANLVKNDKNKKEEKTDSNSKWKIDINNINFEKNQFSFKNTMQKQAIEVNGFDLFLDYIKINGSNIASNIIKLNAPKLSYITKDIRIDSNNLKLKTDKFNLKNENIFINNISLNNNTTINNKDFNITIDKTNLGLNKLKIVKSIISVNNLKTSVKQIKYDDFISNILLINDNIDILAKDSSINASKINLNDINLNISKILLKDAKNKLQIISNNNKLNTKILNINDSKIDILNTKLNTDNLFINQNSNKINLSKILLDLDKIGLKGSNVDINKIVLNNSKINFENINKLKIDVNNTNVLLNKLLIKDSNIDIDSIKVTKPNLSLSDLKNNMFIDTKNLTLALNKLSKKNDDLTINSIQLKEPKINIKNKNDKTHIKIENIDFNVNKIKNTTKTLNIANATINNPKLAMILQKIKKKPTKKKKTKKTKKSKKEKNIHIGPIYIKNAQLNFEDRNLTIPFKTNITKLNGNISDYNNNKSVISKLNIKGEVNKYATAKIKGKVDASSIKLLTDVSMIFNNIAIKDFTPYSSKFVGREIDSGKLDLNLTYDIKKSKLNAQNEIIIKKIKLGKTVKSKDATTLPLDLAIALLEDSSGNIDINLPLKGNLDDPQFSIAPIVWKAFVNLITKAITAPFSLLGSIFGFSEDEIRSVHFNYGNSQITPMQKETLDKITKILKKKQNIAIEIAPSYNKQKDVTGLKKIAFKKSNEINLSNDKYILLLEEIYKNQGQNIDKLKLQHSTNKILNQKAYIDSLETFASSKEKINNNSLDNLANNRVKNIKKYLIEHGVKAQQIKISKKLDIKKGNNKTLDIDLKIDMKK